MQRRKFSREFKLEAVKLVRERGVSVSQAARDLDLHENVLRKGVREQTADPGSAFPGHGVLKPEQQEIERLRRELARMKAERDILKNCLGFGPPVSGRNGLCYAAGGGSRPLAYWWCGTPLKNVARGHLRT